MRLRPGSHNTLLEVKGLFRPSSREEEREFVGKGSIQFWATDLRVSSESGSGVEAQRSGDTREGSRERLRELRVKKTETKSEMIPRSAKRFAKREEASFKGSTKSI